MKDKKKTNEGRKEMRDGVRAVWGHIKYLKPRIIVLAVLGLVSAAANGFVPYITGKFLDALIGVSQNSVAYVFDSWPLWAVLLGVWAFVQVVANIVDWIADRRARVMSTETHVGVQAKGLKRLLHAPMSFHKGNQISGVIEQISGVSWRLNSILGIISRTAPELLSIVVGIVLAASINVVLACVLVVGVLIYIALLSRILAPIAKLNSEAHKQWNERWNDTTSSIYQIESVKQASSEEYETGKIKTEMLGKTVGMWNKIEMIWSNIGFFQRMIVLVTQFTIFFLSVYFVSEKVITVGELVALNGYAMMFFGPFVSLGHQWQTIQNGIIKAAQAEKAFAAPQEVYSPEGAVVPENIAGKIEFKNVSFRYEKDTANILSDVNISVEPGKTVAFVGESGVGKSTAISLMSAYTFPSEGEVLVDGIDTRKIDLNALRKRIGVVPQEVALFNDTIKTNIKYGTFDATDEQVVEAAKQAHIDEFIETLPKKYETIVGERGVKLSVGQKQRVAIARAILRNPRILILDEPTSALDSKTERFITAAMEELMKGRTTFIIAHRLSTVRTADKIFVFEKGRIVESGKHEDLMNIKNGVYRDMYEQHVGLK